MEFKCYPPAPQKTKAFYEVGGNFTSMLCLLLGRKIPIANTHEPTEAESVIVNPHVDLTSVTLLMQNEVDGLEVLSDRTGEWIPAPKLPDCILVNTGNHNNNPVS